MRDKDQQGRVFQRQAFPSWQREIAFRLGAQSEAASKAEGSLWETAFGACAAGLKADDSNADGKAVVPSCIMGDGGVNGR